ncbi:hypothetical protein [Mesorhizobium sp. M0847]|uniref:hypothetical protein n=1 Tax=unclassified Mesorhizobium TaxID=325217 RepID=UPI0033374C4A
MIKIAPENKARQGRWGWHGLRILVAALLLAFIAWGAAEIYGQKIDPDTPEGQGQPTGQSAPANQSAPAGEGQSGG